MFHFRPWEHATTRRMFGCSLRQSGRCDLKWGLSSAACRNLVQKRVNMTSSYYTIKIVRLLVTVGDRGKRRAARGCLSARQQQTLSGKAARLYTPTGASLVCLSGHGLHCSSGNERWTCDHEVAGSTSGNVTVA